MVSGDGSHHLRQSPGSECGRAQAQGERYDRQLGKSKGVSSAGIDPCGGISAPVPG